jgi:RNA polymerase sigma-70 factor (ECF subfamily)
MTRSEFVTLVEATQRAFRRFLVALCSGDTNLADDIAQESYIRAFMNHDSLGSTDSFRPWLYRIGYNCFISHKRTVRPTVDYEQAPQLSSSNSADGAFRYQELYAALDMLPPKERSAILLFYLEGYAIKEIAEIIDASQDAVKQQLSRGRTHLRTLMHQL